MSELEIALLVVLILIVIILLWKWYKTSSDACLSECNKQTQSCSDQCSLYQKMIAQGAISVAPPSAVNPDLSSPVGSTLTDGYSDMGTGPLYGPGSDAYDAYSASQYGEGFAPGRPFTNSLLREGHVDIEQLKHEGLNHGVLKSHSQYLNGALKRTSGASKQSVNDSYNLPNNWMGLQRPSMHIAKSDPGARTISSEYHTQIHPGARIKWGASSNDYDASN